MSDSQFKLQINFTKSYVGEDGGHYLEGVASGPEVDLTDERMSPDALKSMVSSIAKRLVEFRDAHKQEWNDDLGEVVELSLDESNHLIYRSRLDMNLSGSKDLWYRVHTLGKKYGVSIGGAVLKAGMEYVAELGRQVYTYFDVDLYEISITRQAAYQYSFANAVLKSLPRGTAMPEIKEDVTKTEEVTNDAPTAQEVTEDVAAEEQSDATQTEGQEVETEEGTEDAAEQSDAETETAEERTEEVTTEEVAVAAESAEVATDTDPEVTKALSGSQAEVATLQKSLTDTQGRVDELNKSLSAKTDEATALRKSLDETTNELETVKKSLAEKQIELEKRDGRKAIVFDKFGGEVQKSQSIDEEMAEKAKKFNKDFAKKFIGAY